MLAGMKLITFHLVFGTGVVQAAINIDGSQAVQPAILEDDPSPISDINSWQPDQHDCPLPCLDYSNTNSWTPYLSVDRLDRCDEPLLLQFSVTQPLDNPNSNILIRSCSLASGKNGQHVTKHHVPPVENPKKSTSLLNGGSLESAPACSVVGLEISERLQLITSSGLATSSRRAVNLLDGLRKYFRDDDNCSEKFSFAYHNGTVAGIYIGPGLGKPTADSVLGALMKKLDKDGSITNRTAAQLCGHGRQRQRVFGVVVDTDNNLAAVQKMTLGWSHGTCAGGGFLTSAGHLEDAKVYDIAALDSTFGFNNTLNGTEMTMTKKTMARFNGRSKAATFLFDKRDTCRYIQVFDGDGCASLAARCGITGYMFSRFNRKENFCSTLQIGDYACCSSGTPYEPPKPDAPKKGADGICATHYINNGDTCADLAKQNGITVQDIEKWNKGKVWAWTECKDMLYGYSMCLSDGLPPMPLPQQGTQCGPLVPGTQRPKDSSISFADLNPCPLKACCSNWGFCGVFPAHCDKHAPEDGSPGSKLPGFQNTCVSNCGNEIKKNSDAPEAFQRIGYYEAFGLDRECLWLKAKNANTDGTYTHIHWAFATIDPTTWKLVVNDTHKQWNDFKALEGVKRILSFGGWAYSTEPATFKIIRSAILDNRDTFAANLAQFAKDEGIDGFDIDWEYPGAPDILVDGQPIGQKGDGLGYLEFLTVLRKALGSEKSISIAAPASYWYLQAFPIDRIAKVIDYIVYMTYDLHGQWDYGNANAFDSCPSGKCIRSHVNLTETRNCLSMITKAGVPNNKIFVGEASYGRTFHMAKPGCWGPLCDFTGSRTQSDARPGRCTKTGGYIAYAEINEMIKREDNVRIFHDGQSNTDVMLVEGDYVSYMTPLTKETRRSDWKGLNFAGTIDWAVDLQQFTSDDFDALPDRPTSGQGCIAGGDLTISSGTLCAFSCHYGFCPGTLCECYAYGLLNRLPADTGLLNIRAFDSLDPDLNRLCKFACKYGRCESDICDDAPDDSEFDPENASPSLENSMGCYVYQDTRYSYLGTEMCYKQACAKMVEEAKKEGRITNYGCVGVFPLDKPIPWQKTLGGQMAVLGRCNCDNALLNELADTVLDAMAAVAQIGCYILMSALKMVIDVGSDLFPEVGKSIEAGLDAATAAAKMYQYVYPDSEDPAGAFEWWLSPCGGTDLVPDDIKKAFGILGAVTDGVGSWKKPKNVEKGSGKRGDALNPKTRTKLPPGNKPGPAGNKQGSGGKGNRGGKKKCQVPAYIKLRKVGRHTIRLMECDQQDKTQTTDWVVTSLKYRPDKKGPHGGKTLVEGNCVQRWSQACYHYSSVVGNNNKWNTLTCLQRAATKTNGRSGGPATAKWRTEHGGTGWLATSVEVVKETSTKTVTKLTGLCDMDEYPPAYLMDPYGSDFQQGGTRKDAQLVRFLPMEENRGAGSMWKGICFMVPLDGLTTTDMLQECKHDKNPKRAVNKGITQYLVSVTATVVPEFTIATWGQSKNPPVQHGLLLNTKCWPKTRTPQDPGFALLEIDPWYSNKKKKPAFDYAQRYDPLVGNGV